MDCIGDLFNQEYELQAFAYKGVDLKVLCSKSASTDFDLTGQIIWPSAIELAHYIIDNPSLFAGKNILELGAGAGLSGIVAYQYAKNVVISDGNEIVTQLISQNVDLHRRDPTSLIAKQFIWGKDEAQKLIDSLPFTIDIIIGADIIFWQQSIVGLAETVGQFTQHNPDTLVYITGAKRSQQTEDGIDENLHKHANKSRQVLQIYSDYHLPIYLYTLK